MKKYCLIIAFFVIFGIFGGANAALVPYGTDAIRDTTTGLLWWQDLSDFKNQTYSAQQAMIEGLEGGIGWHMASRDEMATLFGVYPHDNPPYDVASVLNIFKPSGIHVEAGEDVEEYFGSVKFEYSGATHQITTFYLYSDGTYTGYPFGPAGNDAGYWGAWATRTVPIPSAVWLLGSGLIGIVGLRRRKS